MIGEGPDSEECGEEFESVDVVLLGKSPVVESELFACERVENSDGQMRCVDINGDARLGGVYGAAFLVVEEGWDEG